jgi:5-formyltetrahydrofolate cyclo-ligase
MRLNDIRERKRNLRLQSMRLRDGLSEQHRAELNAQILDRFLALREYREADIVYTYVSKPSEPDTTSLIEAALAAGKRVAVPRCLPENVAMEFYEISSLQELEPGSYGILEPNPERNPPAALSDRAVCVVPGLSFDSDGFRLGYGKGYYDRFLAGFGGPTVGLCYSGCVRRSLPRGHYDRPVDVLVTEKFVCRTAGRFTRR